MTARDQLLAELDAESAPVPACPSWCTLRAGHGWDSIDHHGRRLRSHGGPDFGRYVGTSAEEIEGDSTLSMRIWVEVEANLVTAAEVRQLADEATAAAAWLEGLT